MSRSTMAAVAFTVATIVGIGVLVQGGWLGTEYADQAIGALGFGAGGAGIGWWARGRAESGAGELTDQT